MLGRWLFTDRVTTSLDHQGMQCDWLQVLEDIDREARTPAPSAGSCIPPGTTEWYLLHLFGVCIDSVTQDASMRLRCLFEGSDPTQGRVYYAGRGPCSLEHILQTIDGYLQMQPFLFNHCVLGWRKRRAAAAAAATATAENDGCLKGPPTTEAFRPVRHLFRELVDDWDDSDIPDPTDSTYAKRSLHVRHCFFSLMQHFMRRCSGVVAGRLSRRTFNRVASVVNSIRGDGTIVSTCMAAESADNALMLVGLVDTLYKAVKGWYRARDDWQSTWDHPELPRLLRARMERLWQAAPATANCLARVFERPPLIEIDAYALQVARHFLGAQWTEAVRAAVEHERFRRGTLAHLLGVDPI